MKNAFVTSTGLVCGRKGLIKECCHYTWEGQFEICSVQASDFYQAAKEEPKNLLIFDDDETYLIVHHPWYKNYYHWLTETIFRLWMIKEKSDQMILLLPPENTLPKIAMDSLKIFKFKRIIHLSFENSAYVRTLCMPELKPDLPSFHSTALAELNKMYVNYARSIFRTDLNLGDKVFLSRRNAARRKIINEDAVIATLKKYKFTIVCSEDYTFFEQVSIFSYARYLAGSHGAGFTNMIFMAPGAVIFELHKRRTNMHRHHNLIFWYMADALGHRYNHQLCEPTSIEEPFYSADIVVDIKQLNENLELMLHDKKH